MGISDADNRKPLKIGLVGLGKIAVDQHIPAIRANDKLELVAGCSPHARPEGLPAYPSMTEMLRAHPEIEAVSICTPPQIRHAIAKEAIAAGKHVFLEKPPAATLGEAEAIRNMAQTKGISLLARTASLIGHLQEESERPIGFILSGAAAERIGFEPGGDG